MHDSQPYQWYAQRPPPAPLASRFEAGFLDARAADVATTFANENFFPHALIWLAFAATSGIGAVREGRRVATIALLLVLPGAFLISVAGAPVFAHWRTLHTLLPALVFCGAHGIDTWYR